MKLLTYTPGRLAKKLGVSKTRLMNHLRKTGLINQCFLSEYGHWQIPYSVAARISSAEALAVPPPTPRGTGEVPRRRNKHAVFNGTEARQPLPNQKQQDLQFITPPYSQPNYRQIGKTLRGAGTTMTDLIKYIQQQMDVTHEQSQNNSAKRDETQTDEPKSSGSASSDIPSSRAK